MADYSIRIEEYQEEYEFLLNILSYRTLEGAKENVSWHVSQADGEVFSSVKLCPNGASCADVVTDPNSEFSGDVNTYLLKFSFAAGATNGTYNIFLEQNESLKLLNIEIVKDVAFARCVELPTLGISKTDYAVANCDDDDNKLTFVSDGAFIFFPSANYFLLKNGAFLQAENHITQDDELTFVKNPLSLPRFPVGLGVYVRKDNGEDISNALLDINFNTSRTNFNVLKVDNGDHITITNIDELTKICDSFLSYSQTLKIHISSRSEILNGSFSFGGTTKPYTGGLLDITDFYSSMQIGDKIDFAISIKKSETTDLIIRLYGDENRTISLYGIDFAN